MPNGKPMLDELEYNRLIKGLSDRELQEFTARQLYDIKIIAFTNTERIGVLEKRDVSLRRAGGIGGAIGSAIGAGVVCAVNYFTGKNP